MTSIASITSVVFDFDGTLVDSAPAILECFASTLASHRIAARTNFDSTVIGPPLVETLSRITGADDPLTLQALADTFKQQYDATCSLMTPVYSGVGELLNFLGHAKVPLYIATNKRTAPTQRIVGRLGWHERFSGVYALDTSEPRLPNKTALLRKVLEQNDLDSGSVTYIGDKAEDGVAADANGILFCYAAWGYGDLKREDCPAKWVWLDTPKDFIARMGKGP